jgi:hypothetical protein
MDNHLTGGDVARLLKVSNQALSSLIKRDRLKATKMSHNKYEIARQDLLDYIQLRTKELKTEIHKLDSVRKAIQ